MGCPYIDNEKAAMVCPSCGSMKITSSSPKARDGCVCLDCGHILCSIPKC